MKFFRRSEPVRPDLAAALDGLDRLAEQSPALSDAVAIQRAILRVVYHHPPLAATVGDLALERARDKLHGGVPLLRGESVGLDMAAARALLLELCRAVGRQPGTAAIEIGAAIEQAALDVPTLIQAVLGGQADAIRERASALGLDGQLLCTLLRFSLFPALEQLAAQLAPLRSLATWQQGYCPTCGSWPLLGEYRGLEQTRFLRCGLCATEWSIDRLVCPFCGCRDHRQLGYLHVEDDQQRRAATCGQCRCYNKMIATLISIPPIELAVYDLTTIHLDLVALEHGYVAPT
ncbi:MAG TPA: formate dehydrogenase accessory protein FdhE [Roseiflexaceae bacterium]|nr:formate dehydrogenase accessory protein FdhE [Roseiflexaceae bacterium]